MSTLHSRHPSQPNLTSHSRSNALRNPGSNSGYSRSQPTKNNYGRGEEREDSPWNHMANTYTWVVENEYIGADMGNRKTEQWILQQQMFSKVENANRPPIGRRHTTGQQRVCEEMVYSYEVKADRWMKQEEEARRRAAERERRARLVDEEIHRIETKVRFKREEERRKIAEEWRKIQEEQRERDRRNRRKADKAIVEAWHRYEDQWEEVLSSSQTLDFGSIPWPTVSMARKAEEITAQAVISFLFSELHSGKQSRKERLRRAQLRWHPDRFQRILARVEESNKAEVEEGVGIVARSTLAAYLAYHLSSKSIALDSEHPTTSLQSPALSEPSAETTPVTSEEEELLDATNAEGGLQETNENEPQDSPASGGAFNPVTGEINWDCPCLGGMAHGPCGPQFREAFSCFVFSEDEPKGINCVEKFKAMQNCFREHPEIYADEIDDDDEESQTAPVSAENNAPPSSIDEPESEHAPQLAIAKPQDLNPDVA
ncbi:hypothetical protein H0H93_003406 [Arthromyces matolae]|nr:hypothetical protein H0H93_003406 [Arthromyces matolae]